MRLIGPLDHLTAEDNVMDFTPRNTRRIRQDIIIYELILIGFDGGKGHSCLMEAATVKLGKASSNQNGTRSL